jgi:hypothetical protein
LIARRTDPGRVVIDRSIAQRFHCLLKRATNCRGLEMATVVAIPIRKPARGLTVLRKAVR